MNLITKIASSPFAALGNLVGGDGEESAVCGVRSGRVGCLTENEQRKLQIIEQRLSASGRRCVWKWSGHVDPKLDGRGIGGTEGGQSAVLDRLGKTNKKSSQALPTAEREFDLLNELYIEKFGKQPMKREETGGGKSVERVMSRDEIREELIGAAEVSEQELRELAQARAGEIRQYLVQQGRAEEQIVVTGVELTARERSGVRSRLNLTGA